MFPTVLLTTSTFSTAAKAFLEILGFGSVVKVYEVPLKTLLL